MSALAACILKPANPQTAPFQTSPTARDLACARERLVEKRSSLRRKQPRSPHATSNRLKLRADHGHGRDQVDIPEELAGAAGFEPAHGGTKNRCLTAWLRPNLALARHCRRCASGRLYSQFAGGSQGCRTRIEAGLQPSLRRRQFPCWRLALPL